ncbi:MAG: hypothetical protein RMK75_04025 [Aquificaceae bacterium]|nr:hypothetical protein [Aquificaceae bacterium]MDW8066098.1 hypothetical protein [Aquificaceae bacterium]MDW8423475.1 hypothetical protein [Aquificaceae bacterium]
MLFLVFVVSPLVRKLSIRDKLFQGVGRRFSLFGTFGTLSMLAVTGLFNVYYLLGLSNLVFVVFVSLAHDVYFGPIAVNSPFY